MRTCPHLEPLERELESLGVALGEGEPSPYGAGLGTWFPVRCTFDEAALRARLQISPVVTYCEYDGRHAGSDATWFCRICNRAIMGDHPNYARIGAPRIS